MTHSTWGPFCGDGIIVGSEIWDDGSWWDGKGWNSNCSGFQRGWYWSGSTISIWATHLMDGIHVAGEEGCDDGNNIDSGDGWTNSGVVENGFIWTDDILQK